MNEHLPDFSEVGKAVAGIAAAIGTALVIWRRTSSTKLSVGEDSSKGDWLKDTEDRLQKALDREQAAIQREQLALERERTALLKIAGLEARIALQAEGLERKDRRITRLSRILMKHAPELAEALDSLPGVLDSVTSLPPPTGEPES